MHGWIAKSSATAVTVALSATLAGCGAATAAAPHKNAAVVVALPVDSSPNWFFPVYTAQDFTSTNEQVDALLYKPLLDITDHNTVDYARSIVNKITVNTANTVFTLHVNPQYHWSNGKPVTAQDIVFTWNIMNAASSNASNLPWNYGGAGTGGIPADFRSVSAVNASTVRVTLNTPVNAAWFIRNGLGQVNPVPMSVWNRYPHDMTKELAFIKSVANSPTSKWYSVVDGPYRLTSFTANQQWVFMPNTRYSGGKAKISPLIFQYETSSASEFTALKTHAVTVGCIPLSLWSSRRLLTGYTITPAYTWGMTYLQLNFNDNAPNHIDKLFDKLYIRQALDMGINQPAIVRSLYHGEGIESNGPVPSQPRTSFYDKTLDTLTYPYNPTRAKALLEHHGWHLVNGVMTRDGVKLAFSLNYATGSQTADNVVQFLKSEWAREGVQVSLLPTSNASFPLPNNKWDAIFSGLTSWVYSPDFYPTGGGLFKTGAALNFWGYSNGTMNHLVDMTYAPYTSTSEELARMDAYQAFASRHLPLLFLPYAASVFVSSNKLSGYRASINVISGLLSPNEWTIK